ncbi:MAG: hypothetical protein JO371_14155 [Paraburkholderia sp.]|nr:hypothetical protein [Paraburkholderia sp.]
MKQTTDAVNVARSRIAHAASLHGVGARCQAAYCTAQFTGVMEAMAVATLAKQRGFIIPGH